MAAMLRRRSVDVMLRDKAWPARFVLLVVNGQEPLPHGTRDLIKQAHAIVAADGGARRLHALDPDAQLDLLIGDMDSLQAHADIVAHYQAQQLEQRKQGRIPGLIQHLTDQDSTDLQKALAFLLQVPPHPPAGRLGDVMVADHAQAEALPLVVVPGGLSGRLDHTLQSLNTALMFHSRVRLVFWTDENSAEVLPPGHHHIQLDREREGPHCGLLPLQGAARVRTEGLQWELFPTPELEMAWGGLLSTSNRVRGAALEVESHAPLLWTIERRVDHATRACDPDLAATA